MSGGSFGYAYSKMQQFAEELRVRLEDDDQGWDDPAVARTLHEIAALADRAAAYAKEAEWLYSGDTGEESFLRRVAQIRAKEIPRVDDVPRPGSRWRHPPTGGTYTVLDTCNRDAPPESRNAYPLTVAYYDADRRVWARGLAVWRAVMVEMKDEAGA